MEIKEIKEHLEKLSIEEQHDIYHFVENLIGVKRFGNVPIGETFEFLDYKEYIVKIRQPECHCEGCVFDDTHYDQTCKYLCCSAKYRDDNQSVIFVTKDEYIYDEE